MSSGGEEAAEYRANTGAVVGQLTRLGSMTTEELIRAVADSRGIRIIDAKFRDDIVETIHSLLFWGTLAVGESGRMLLKVPV